MKRISLIFSLIVLVSCGQEAYEKSSAPTTQSQAGLIASCVTREEAQNLAQSQGISYRVINAKRKLIEFYGVDSIELSKHFPKSKFRKNTVYELPLVNSGGDFGAKSSGDYPFYGAHTPEYRSGDVSRYFPHLAQIDGETFVSSQMGEGAIIAIVDTGVYYNHPHISPNILTNPSENHASGSNSIDDDGNGYTNDYVGWDFYNGDAFPLDDHGHGTHVAGLAAGTYGGIAPKAKILAIKALSSNGNGDLATIAAGILYAIDRGAHIVNLSLGGPGAGEASKDLEKLFGAMNVSANNDVLIVAAAGNGGVDGLGDCNDTNPIYPASFSHPNIMSVAAVDYFDELTNYSNFGISSVHISAPGGTDGASGLLSLGIPSCFGPCANNALQYTKSAGTSMATPIVSGLAALIKGARPSLTAMQIKDIIISNGDFIQNLYEKTKYGKRVNVASSLLAALNL